jgi:hypothetical protein
MMGAPFSSLGISAALMFLCAVYCCWNSLSAMCGTQVPGGLLTSVQPAEPALGRSPPQPPYSPGPAPVVHRARYQVIVVDLRGMGGSGKPATAVRAAGRGGITTRKV